MRPEFSAVRFHDLPKAEGNLERIERRLAPQLIVPLASLLTQSPDPDGALNLLDRYVESTPKEVLDELPAVPSALTYLVGIFGYSAYLAETFLAEPALPTQFARDRHFAKLKSREDLTQDYARFATTSPDHWLSAQLARFKRRNYLRIVLKDVLRLSTLGETTLELSALADVILANALTFCDQELEKRYGQPQYRDAQGRIARAGFAILSLGKLGGNELNYSSDIDLLFLYSHDGETSGSTERNSVVANKEYFVRLAHAIARTITQTTPHGMVFRVDLRLRPEGEQGDLAISVRSALEYYEHRARDWELQMLMKARHSAGEARITREFLRGVEPYVYGMPSDFSVIDSVLESRQKLSRKQRQSHGNSIDVKLHRGGIRDIEFLSQCLQRMYGGSDPWVRTGGTLHGLRKLNDKGLISDRDYATLTGSYEFLRLLEHRIQLDTGQQTHRLPTHPDALDRLARRAGIGLALRDAAGLEAAEEAKHAPSKRLLSQVEAAFERVDEVYQRAIHPRAASEALAGFSLRPPAALPGDPAVHSYESLLSFLDTHAPEISRQVRAAEIQERARPKVARFLGAILASSERFRLASERPRLVRSGLDVIGSSDYFASLLIHHPEDLAAWPSEAADSGASPAGLNERTAPEEELLLGAVPGSQPGSLAMLDASLPPRLSAGGPATLTSGPGQAAAAQAVAPREVLDSRYPAQRASLAAPFPWATEKGLDVREKMALLRRHYRSQVLVLGAAELGSLGSIFASLSRWSALAVGSISSALWIACHALRVQTPDDGAPFPLAILGLGRLGLNEFDLASDADLLFVTAPRTSPDELTRWIRVAEKTIEVLSSYTRDGTLFAVDTRLRPQGREGELVITEDELLNYLTHGARAWEALTYLKASPVAGDLDLGVEVTSRLVAKLFDRFGGQQKLEDELHQMRQRLEKGLDVRPTDTKTAPGGYYDVEFCVSYLRLRHCVANVPIGANTVEQIAALRSAGLVSEDDARALTEGAVVLRSVDHAIRLVTGRPSQGLLEHAGQADSVEALTRRWGLLPAGEPLADRLRQAQHEVRQVYQKLLAPD